MAGKATLQEMEAHWSICDLQECHDAMDLDIRMQRKVSDKATSDTKKDLNK